MNEIPQILGALERTPDVRDFPLGTILGAVGAPIRPDSFSVDVSWLTRNYQGQKPACGPHSGSHLKAILDFSTAALQERKTPRYGWIKLKDVNSPVYDGHPLSEGTDMRSIFKWLQTFGADDFDPLENDVTLSDAAYADPSAITSDMDANAALSKISSYAFGDADFDSICQQVWQAKGVLLLVKVDEGFWYTKTPTFTTPKWGHFIVAYGYTPDGILVIDSADPSDENAFKFVNKEYILPQFFVESGTAVDIPPSVHQALTQGQIETAQQILANMTKILELDKEWLLQKVANPSPQ